jgi:hypothetical protein
LLFELSKIEADSALELDSRDGRRAEKGALEDDENDWELDEVVTVAGLGDRFCGKEKAEEVGDGVRVRVRSPVKMER